MLKVLISYGLYLVAGLLVVVGGGVQEVMRQIEFGVKLIALTCCSSKQ